MPCTFCLGSCTEHDRGLQCIWTVLNCMQVWCKMPSTWPMLVTVQLCSPSHKASSEPAFSQCQARHQSQFASSLQPPGVIKAGRSCAGPWVRPSMNEKSWFLPLMLCFDHLLQIMSNLLKWLNAEVASCTGHESCQRAPCSSVDSYGRVESCMPLEFAERHQASVWQHEVGLLDAYGICKTASAKRYYTSI